MESNFSYEETRDLNLGDRRRTSVVRTILASAERRPGGTVTSVLKRSSEREAAYRLLESEHTSYEPLRWSFALATARRAAERPFAFVLIDGSSLTLTDRANSKFGGVGSTASGGRGMKVITAYAVDSNAIPIGILDQQWWARPPRKKGSRAKSRKLSERETVHWCDAIEAARHALRTEAPETKPWFVLDREGDGFYVLKKLHTDGFFTVRANANRRVVTSDDKRRQYLDDVLRRCPVVGVKYLAVPGTEKRCARNARLHVRTTQVELRMQDVWTKAVVPLTVNVVELREVHTTPRGEKPILWRLYTNHDVSTPAGIDLVVQSYRARWRVEEFHKTWKSGACDVENSQLQSQKSLVMWATIMATVAARIERLKLLSRAEPEMPPENEFSKYELKALLMLKKQIKKRTEVMPRRIPTLKQAVLWLAELGGYTGKSSGGPPGSITIRRGFDILRVAAQILEIVDKEGKCD
jgi:Transposase DNA-binding